jgi:hypothetical protein
VPFQECLRRLGRKCLNQTIIGVGQIEDHEVRRLLYACNDDHSFAEIGLRFARRMAQGHEHLLAADPELPNVVLHHGVAARVSVLGLQPLEDPLGRVPLLARPLLVIRQNGVDHALPRTKLGSPDRRLPPVPRRQRILQHLAYRLPRQPKFPGYRPPALALYKNRPPHPRIDLHGVHTSGVPRREAPLTGSEPCSLPPIGSVVHGTRMWRVDYFYPATSRRFRGATWSIFDPARTTPLF